MQKAIENSPDITGLELCHTLGRDDSGAETIITALLQFTDDEEGAKQLFQTLVINVNTDKCWSDNTLENLVFDIDQQLYNDPVFGIRNSTKILIDSNLQQYARSVDLWHHNGVLRVGEYSKFDIQFLAVAKSHSILANHLVESEEIIIADNLRSKFPKNLPIKSSSLAIALGLLAARVRGTNDHLYMYQYGNVTKALESIFGREATF